MIFLRDGCVIRLYELHHLDGCRIIPAENRLKVFLFGGGVSVEELLASRAVV